MQTICIVGGGLGGLALAHAIVRECPEKKVLILERDESAVARSQGIIIGVQQEGIDALVRLGGEPILKELRNVLQKVGPTDVRILDKNGATLIRGREWLSIKLAGEPMCALVDRAVLRNILATTLPEGVIQWDSKMAGMEVESDGVWVSCSNGSRIRADLVIGADGYRSQVRATRCPQLAPVDLGVWQVAGIFECPEAKDESELLRHARTSLVRMNGGSGLSLLMFTTTAPSTPNSPPVVPRCLWSVSMPSSIAQQFNMETESDRADVREKILRLMRENFNDMSVEAVSRTTPEGFMPGYEMSSIPPEMMKGPSPLNGMKGQSWRVMLIGDALHKTTTQAGLGATAAFQDAVTVFEMIRGGKGITEEAVQKCNNKLWKAAAWVVNMSAGNTKRLHAVPGPVMSAVAPCVMRFVNGILFTIYYCRKGFRQLKSPGVALGLAALLLGSAVAVYVDRPWTRFSR